MKLKLVAAAAALLVASAGASAQSEPVGGFTLTPGLFQSSYSLTLSGPSNVFGELVLLGSTTFASVNLFGGSTLLSDLNAADGFSFSNISAGSYTLLFTGSAPAAGGFGGYYTVSVVPEPETYAMMLAGLGIMGFMAARRRQG